MAVFRRNLALPNKGGLQLSIATPHHIVQLMQPRRSHFCCVCCLCAYSECSEHVRRSGLQVTAAVVTCGGLCPGLNDVVQNIVSSEPPQV